MARKRVKIQDVVIGGNRPLALIAGPCVLESQDLVFQVAGFLKELTDKLGMSLIFKSSFDKANRTSISSFRGPGLSKGLKMLADVKIEFGIPLITDIHKPEEAALAAEVVDIIQIPAFMCRQTDLIIAAALTKKAINIKKGQFLAPWDVENIIAKIESAGNNNILITERGSTFGYNNLVVDMRNLLIMREYNYPVVFDATHSVQYPGGSGTESGGDSRFVPYLARAAAAVGVDAVFMEVHPEPKKALCDGPNAVNLKDLPDILRNIKIIDALVKNKIKRREVEKLIKNE